MSPSRSAVLSIALIASGAPSSAQSQAAPIIVDRYETTEPDIVVIGFARPYRLTAKQIFRAQSAFDANRGRLAPSSELFFKVTSQSGNVHDVDLYLKSGNRNIDLKIDDQSRIVVPRLDSKDWVLLANRSRKGIAVTPMVLSPGTSERDRRLGDLRLQCEVYWAMSSSETSVLVRAMFSAANGCRGGRFGFYVSVEDPISSGRVTDGTRERPLRLWGGLKYQAPIGDDTMPDSARVLLDPP